jgi:hypothetical protein
VWIDADHPANQGVLRSLCTEERLPKNRQPLLIAGTEPKASEHYGCHPDIVERVWDELGKSLPEDCRCLVYGRPALVHPGRGVVIAVCYGTQYCLRIPQDCLPEALDAGATVTTTWSGGGEMNVQEEFGPDWVFGNFSGKERAWLKAVYRAQGS